MSNDVNPNGADGRIDELINRALREVVRDRMADDVWPADEVTLAYLKGAASPDQREEVQAALAQSSSYRRFLADTEDLILGAESNEGRAAYNRVMVPHHLSERPDRTQGGAAIGRPWWESFMRPVLWFPAIVVAVLVIWFATRSPGPAGPGELAFAPAAELEQSDFVSFETRGSEARFPDTSAAATDREAALKVLQSCIEFNTSTMTYQFTPGKPQRSPVVRSYFVQLTLSDTTGHQIVAATSGIPATWSFDSTQVTAWLIVPPALTLYKAPIPTPQAALDWPVAPPGTGCLTFTYRSGAGYLATPGQVLRY